MSGFLPPPPPGGSAEPPRPVSHEPPRSPPRSARPRRRGFFGFLGRILLILLVMAILGAAGLVALSWMLFEPPPEVQDGTWLEVFFSQDYPEERAAPEGLLGSLREEDLSAQELAMALRRARDDHRIAGVLLRPDGFPGGWAQAQEIRDALAAIRAAGKPVWAYVEAPAALPYFLATAADSIAMAPEGSLFLLGLRARMLFLKGTLDKLGITADYIAVGEYKSAPEQLTRADPTEPSREQVAQYLDDVYDSWVGSMAGARGLTPDRMSMLVDAGLFDSDAAVAEGLIDSIVDERGLWNRVQPGVAPALRVDPREYLAASSPDVGTTRYGSLALVYLTGTIVSGHSTRDGFGEDMVGSDTVIERLEQAREDEDVKAVVLRIDSPGGSAIASDLIYREILRVQADKPVVVSMGDVAASGGYYVAMSGDRILADPLTLTGSIGVYAGKMDMRGFYDKLGLSFEVFLRGENADTFSDLKPFTRVQRERIRKNLEAFYGRFVQRVAEGRALDVEDVDRIARGRVWSGHRSIDIGLVDETGGLEQAIAAAKRIAGIPPIARVPIHTYQPSVSLLQRLLRQVLRGTARSNGSLGTDEVQRMLAGLRSWRLTMDGSPQFHVPWRLRIE